MKRCRVSWDSKSAKTLKSYFDRQKDKWYITQKMNQKPKKEQEDDFDFQQPKEEQEEEFVFQQPNEEQEGELNINL